MPVKMVALRTYYSNNDSKEYPAGATFSVSNDLEADRLERMRKAKRDVPNAAQRSLQPAPNRATRTKVMTAEPEPAVQMAAAPIEPVHEPSATETPIIESSGNRYRRSDMRSED